MANSKLIDTLADLIRINSINPAYAGGQPESAVQRYIADFFARHGVSTFEQEVLPGRSNLIARLPGKIPGRRLVFEAHSDTAGVEGMVIPPFDPQVRGGRVYGRGACDTKAGLAAMMHALADLRASGTTPPCEVWVVAAVDEEHTYRGVLKLREGLQAAGGVVAEPTDLRMVVASKGCVRWQITARGKAAHSSKPHLGVNAILRMGRVLAALEAHTAALDAVRHPLLGSPTLNVGMIAGGTQVNVVPDSCTITLDRRLIPGEEPRQVLDSYAQLLQSDPHVVLEPPLLEDWPLETPLDSPIVTCLGQVLRDAGLDGRPAGVPFGSDASKLSRVGIPSVILGPGSIDQAHTAEEYVEVEQVEKAFAVYRELMRRFE